MNVPEALVLPHPVAPALEIPLFAWFALKYAVSALVVAKTVYIGFAPLFSDNADVDTDVFVPE